MALIRFRRALAAEWTTVNPILRAGEPGFETDTGLMKIGNGTDAWIALDYLSSGDGGAGEPGVTDHGALTGLGDDDHAQYFNQARGDARYAQITALANYLTTATASTTYASKAEVAALDAADVGAIPAGDITVIDVVTQAQYDAIDPKVATTLYVIQG